MKKYYVSDNAQANGDHEVHNEDCSYLPAAQNRTYLGIFDNCYDAVNEAKRHYGKVNGCYYCSRPCHTG